ncbi:glucose 1-dehydrogenase [Peristeroidobacter agariperforans]|uniref:glucose 1-dehydrogenase n=1 Tax=Peristeroidobacter agariperforans TaxID=268404 RepID=UPI00101CCDC3|nr:glucose 1-dehydrogenase [Peristeroidobacter agariperforans]
MQALAVLPEERKLELIDVPRPSPRAATEVLLKVREVGLCGTDREISSFEYGEPPAGDRYLVLGHESLAEVVEVGSAVRSFKPGDLVVALVRRPCPHAECLPCRADRSDFCHTGDYTERGIKEAHGFLTEYAVDDVRFLVRVPKALAEVAVLIEPLTVIAKGFAQSHAIFDRLPYEGGPRRGLILGAGPIGLLGAMASTADGLETVVYSRGPENGERADLVRSFGASFVSADEQPLESLADRTGEFKLILEAVGVASVMMAAPRVLQANGVAILTGIPAEGATVEMDVGRLLRDLVLKNQVMFGTVNAARQDYMYAIDQLERFMTLFPQSVRKLITERVPLTEAAATLLHTGGIKSVVQLDRP